MPNQDEPAQPHSDDFAGETPGSSTLGQMPSDQPPEGAQSAAEPPDGHPEDNPPVGQPPVTGPPSTSTIAWRTGLGTVILGVGFLLVYMLWAIWPVKNTEEPFARPSGAPCSSMPVRPSLAPQAPVKSDSSSAPSSLASSPSDAAGPLAYDTCSYVFGRWFEISLELRLMWIVGLAAALGSFVQIATSFSTFVGNGTFDASWTWWYILRIPIGMALAYLFYFALRGGLLSTSTTASDLSAFGIAAISGLVGLFSKQASDKLEETFKTLFSTPPGTGDDQRADKLTTEPHSPDSGASSTS